jgi:VWFA-related protein
MRWIACGSALVAMAVPAMPQQSAADSQAPSTATIHVQSRLVVLDVVVTDKKGKPLTGLSKSDFTVLEDGKPQTLRHMDYTALAGDSKASGFKSVFVLDVLNSTLDESAYGKAQLAHYLSTQPETLPQPAMLVTVDDRGFKMIAAYTTDRKALQSALHAYKSGIPFDFTRGDNEARLTITFDALRQIALASIGSPGRTELIWLGHGFPAMNLMNIPPQDAATMQALVQNITNQLLEARIVLYKVDPAAVGAPAVTPNMDDADSAFDDTAQPFADSISFDSMIQQTGGHSFFNRNDVDAEFSKAVDLGGSFYTLSYSPTGESTAAAGYRHIRVLVNQPGAKAVTRQGYFKIDAAAAPEAPANPAAVVDGAIINNLVYSALGVHITSLTRAPSGTSTRCFMRLDAKDIHWTLQPDGSRVMNLLVGAATYGANGKPLTYSRDTATLHMDAAAPDSDSALHSDFEIPMHIPPAAASLRIVVLAEETGKLGSADATSIPADAHSLR